MDGFFNLPYSEFEVISSLQKEFKKSDGYSVYIPVSRQQKGIDFIVHNCKTNKILRFQVKSSRAHIHETRELKDGSIKKPEFRYNFWFNNFIDKHEKGFCDYYILFGLYPIYTSENNIKENFWNKIVLCYSDDEMFDLLTKIKTKREKKADKFFSYGFNFGNSIFNKRGISEVTDASEHLLKNKISKIKKTIEINK
ncbi:MAG: hypothetical protein V4570_07645 [Pseudomonadota bacterium]